jgi:hypothetical protein
VEQGKEQMQALIPVDYVVEFEEITVTGDYAFEWGTDRGAVRPRAGGSDVTYSGKLMRIPQRQPSRRHACRPRIYRSAEGQSLPRLAITTRTLVARQVLR